MIKDVEITPLRIEEFSDAYTVDGYCIAKNELDAYTQIQNYINKNGYYGFSDGEYGWDMKTGFIGEYNPKNHVFCEITQCIDVDSLKKGTHEYYVCFMIFKS